MTLQVGEEVVFPGTKGDVSGKVVKEADGFVFVDPDRRSDLHISGDPGNYVGCDGWRLNAAARSRYGKMHYVKARDSGVPAHLVRRKHD